GRVRELIDLVGLHEVARKRAGQFSLGMGQRLGIATALLGDPSTLLLDEPVNGLDPEGILWIRNFMRYLAGQGRTVFVSSHLMSEMAMTAEHLIVVGRGKLLADVTTQEFIESSSTNHVRVRSPQADDLSRALVERGIQVKPVDGYLEVTGAECAQVGDVAAEHHLTIHELFEDRASLEEAFMELTKDTVEYHTDSFGPGFGGPPPPDGDPFATVRKGE
ncbi:MAG TPA: AAA family ATPase, partial [Actinomycetes bacterium]